MKIGYDALKLIIILSAMTFISACSTLINTTTDANSDAVYHTEIDASEGKVIIFPLILNKGGEFQAANTDFDNETLDAYFAKSWSSRLDKGTYIVPKTTMDSIPGSWTAMELMVKSMVDAHKKDQTVATAGVKKFYDYIANTLNGGSVALAIVYQDKPSFESGGFLKYESGLYDISSSKFKWVTVTELKKSKPVPVPFEAAVQRAINDSWQKLEEVSEGNYR